MDERRRRSDWVRLGGLRMGGQGRHKASLNLASVTLQVLVL
jgi:hypothetical protein